MATLATPFEKWADFLDPNQVKLVVDSQGRALYFSRSAIPYVRDREGDPSQSTISNFPPTGTLGYTDTVVGFESVLLASENDSGGDGEARAAPGFGERILNRCRHHG